MSKRARYRRRGKRKAERREERMQGFITACEEFCKAMREPKWESIVDMQQVFFPHTHTHTHAGYNFRGSPEIFKATYEAVEP